MDQKQTKLHEMLVNAASPYPVYFQPPMTLRLQYPCLVYQLDRISARHANNLPYHADRSYTMTFITLDPVNTVKDKLALLPKCRMNRFYTAENMNHYTYTIYD